LSKCAACQYYDRNDVRSEDKGVRWGKCRRSGPMLHPVSTKSYIVEGVWPHVRDDDWCGEWVASTRRVDSTAAAAMNSLLMQTAASSARPSATPASPVGPYVPGTSARVPVMPSVTAIGTSASASSDASVTPLFSSPFGSLPPADETPDVPVAVAQGLRSE